MTRRMRLGALLVAAGTSLTAGLWPAGGAAKTGPAPVEARLQRVVPRPNLAGLSVTAGRRVGLSPVLGLGSIEHRGISLYGLPVRGAFETVQTSAAGTARVVAARYPTVAPALRPSDARVAVTALPARVADALGLPAPATFERPAELVYRLILGEPVLTWEVQQPLTLHPEPSRMRLWVSAATGRVLDEEEQLRSSQARVFLDNPAKTPDPIEVELTGIDAQGPGIPLTGDRVTVFGCVTDEPPEFGPWREEGDCFPVQRTLSDQNGDYFPPLPDVVIPADNVDREDLYAELSMYFHAERFLDAMIQKGVQGFPCEVATMQANFHTLEPSDNSPELPFGPLNNAFYTGRCDPETGTTMLFGQGSAVDFGFDGDVVYHELGHGIVAHVAPEGLSRRRLRPDASLVDASGMNEALADYLSAMVTGDPSLGDYVGRFWPSQTRPYIRSAENGKVCPIDTVGQVHNDGEPFMAALWATRKRVGPVMDAIVIGALARMPPDATLSEGAALVLELAAERRQAGQFDDFDYDVLHRSFDARGLLGCDRVIVETSDAETPRSLFLRRRTEGVSPFFPGPMQLRHVVPEGSDNLLLSYRLRPRSGSDPVTASVLVRRAPTPITFEYTLVAIDDGDPSAGAAVREITLVEGDWDFEVEGTLVAGDQYQILLRGLLPGEVVHLAMVNTATVEAVAREAFVTSVPAGDLDEGTTDGETEGEGSAGREEASASSGVSSGCGCRAGSGRPVTAWAVWSFALLLLRRRRCAG